MTDLQHCPRGGDATGLPENHEQAATWPDRLGFAGLVYCLADCLGECASTPGAPDDWEPLQHMAAAALRAWQALLAEHGPAIAAAHLRIGQARRQGLSAVEVPADLLALLIGEGQP